MVEGQKESNVEEDGERLNRSAISNDQNASMRSIINNEHSMRKLKVEDEKEKPALLDSGRDEVTIFEITGSRMTPSKSRVQSQYSRDVTNVN